MTFDTANITNSTIVGNTAGSGGGGGIVKLGVSTADQIQLDNSIVANNQPGGNCLVSGGAITGTHNLADDGTCPAATSASITLGSLANNGGPTLTHALLPGSAAINAGNNGLIPTEVATDQRGAGFPRIVNGTVDIGAIELGAAPVPVSPIPIPTLTNAGWFVLSVILATVGAWFGFRKRRCR